ncbi:MAG: alpha-galactosidase [Candidatus Omnitrophica bacterium]|nr:alpha-galactosidase [Candidatus Omnitrophota bacterium]
MEAVTSAWTEKYLKQGVPFSFIYRKKSLGELLPEWERKNSVESIDENRLKLTGRYTDLSTGLVIRCEAITYRDFPVVEWTLYLKNTGKKDTPVIENLLPVDILLSRGELGEAKSVGRPVLHYAKGSLCTAEDYRPLKKELAPGSSVYIATSGGRSCNAHLPFFNLEWSGAGIIMAIGWTGQWSAGFKRQRTGQIRLYAGQELTHFRLNPGEEVRTPLIALLFYQGERIQSQNIWRRWMVTYNIPRPGGKLPEPILAAFNWFSSIPYGINNVYSVKAMLDEYERIDVPINALWIDAGWYDCEAGILVLGYPSWDFTGTWKPDRRRYPKGVREASEHAHKKGLKTILWFEPERVRPGTWLYKNHPEWLLNPPARDKEQSHFFENYLLNLSNPRVVRWVIKTIGGLLKSEEIDIYREDFNLDPLLYWRAKDAPDRQGITEIKHVTGHLALWDTLRRQRPDLLIDVCASGGRRNDLESLRRAVPLWRTDYTGFLADKGKTKYARINANQGITYGLSFWIPYFGTGLINVDYYQFASCLCPSLAFDVDPRREDVDRELWRKLAVIHRKVARCFFGDYYPLTEYSLEPSAWIAWQFDLPERGEGMIQVFRREENPEKKFCLKLQALKADGEYLITDLLEGKSHRFSGRFLSKKGLTVSLPVRPSALILDYKQE